MDSRRKLNLNHALQTLKKPFPWFFSHREYIKRRKALETVQKQGDFQVIPILFEFTLKVPTSMMLPVIRVISGILFHRTPLGKPQVIYQQFRGLEIETWHLDDFMRFPEKEAVTLLCLASVNQNGFVREKALRYLSNFEVSEAIPFIIYRLGDWVPSIHKIAHKVFPRFLNQKYLDGFIRYYQLLDWLSIDRKRDLKPMVNSIMRVLTTPRAQSVLKDSLKKASHLQKRFIIKTLAKSTPMEAIRLALVQSDFLLKVSIIPYISKLDYANSIMFLDRFLRDPSGPVRLTTLKHIPPGEHERFQNTFLELVHDQTAYVRAKIRIILQLSGITDFSNIYRDAIKKNVVKPGTLIGLAETGDESDTDLIRPFLQDKNPIVISAAIIALDKFRDNDLYDKLVPFLIHPNRKVKKAAQKIIITQIDREKIQALRSIFRNGQAPNRKTILKILLQYGGWESIIDILFVILYGEKELAEMGWAYLPQWMIRTRNIFLEPDQEDREQARSLFFAIQINHVSVPDRINHHWNRLSEILH